MLPLGLVLLPGALLWIAGRWVVRRGQVARLADVGYAALALAVPYGLVAGALALAGQSALATPSLLQAVVSGFLIALVAGGLGGARALAPWRRLIELLPPRARAVFLGTVGTLTVLTGAGAILAGASLATHMGDFRSVDVALAPGLVGGGLLLLAQLAYIPNAIVWSICYTLGPGFAFGTGTVVAPTGSALGPLPMLPMLAALPSGAHSSATGWVSLLMLSVPYLAGAFGGLLTARAAPIPAVELAPLWGFACGVATGCALGLLAAFAGGPLGSGRLTAVGPSGWQAGVVCVLEVGVAAAVTTGLVNWVRMRRLAPAGADLPRRSARRRDGAMTPTTAGAEVTTSTWTRGVTRRTPRTAGPIPPARHRCLEEPRGPEEQPGLRSGGGVLDSVGELGPARLLRGDGVRTAQALGERTRLLPEQREPGQQDRADQHPDPADHDGHHRAPGPAVPRPPGAPHRGGRQPDGHGPRDQGERHDVDAPLEVAQAEHAEQAQQREEQRRDRPLLEQRIGPPGPLGLRCGGLSR